VDCTKAHRVYTAKRRKLALFEGTLTHGRRSTYDAGCRCALCFAARQEAYVKNERVSDEPYRPHDKSSAS
jgi:hypothetical protein